MRAFRLFLRIPHKGLIVLSLLLLTCLYSYRVHLVGIKKTNLKKNLANKSALGVSASPKRSYQAKFIPKLPEIPFLDQDAKLFQAKTSIMNQADECLPIHMRNEGSVGILYLHCSESALESESQATEVSEEFVVSKGLAKRFHFWRRIYSLWSKDQWVLHSSKWPEVVLEIYDSSKIDHSDDAVKKSIREFAKGKRAQYKKMLLTMHKNRRQPESFTPAMQRLAKSMEHIDQSDKYWTVGHTLRTQRGQRDYIERGLALAPKYLPYIEAEFREVGIPVDIAKLAFVESSFNLDARSRVGASGVFQIMPGTGRQYLRIKGGIDERNDPIKDNGVMASGHYGLQSWRGRSSSGREKSQVVGNRRDN
jgi:hypothetical protein